MNKKYLITVLLVVLFLAGFVFSVYYFYIRDLTKPIKVGILHSMTGTMAISETHLIQSTLMTINEINENGGIMGHPIEPIVVDGRSDPVVFAKEAERLIVEEGVKVIFGGWTSASKKHMRPVVEKYNHLLFYPVQYEGAEISKNIIYTGLIPNQQMFPTIKWALKTFGARLYVVGSDYIYPRIASEVLFELAASVGANIVGEDYVLLGSQDVDAVVDKIIIANPDFILNTINGDTNVGFFKKLREKGITSDKIPTISFSVGETELEQLSPKDMVGDYAVWSYFMTVKGTDNQKFMNLFKKYYPDKKLLLSSPMEASYIAVNLWAKAAWAAQSFEPQDILERIFTQIVKAPSGEVSLDADNHHLWKYVRIGQIREDGLFDIIWTSDRMVRPIPYLPFKTRAEWDALTLKYFNMWDGNWERRE
jgi:urea ABC transporter urea binding protein